MNPSVRLIYELFLSGKTLKDIASHLITKNIPSPAGKEKWYIQTVRSILSNEKYMGEALLQKTYTEDFLTKKPKKNNGEKPIYKVENSHEAKGTFKRVQKELERRRTLRANERTLTKQVITDSNETNVPQRNGTDVPQGNGTSVSQGNETSVSFRSLSHKLICNDCNSYYGHKVWRSRGKSRIAYDVWYCNNKAKFKLYDGRTITVNVPKSDETDRRKGKSKE